MVRLNQQQQAPVPRSAGQSHGVSSKHVQQLSYLHHQLHAGTPEILHILAPVPSHLRPAASGMDCRRVWRIFPVPFWGTLPIVSWRSWSIVAPRRGATCDGYSG
jgi:hypothetical protein